MGYTAEEKENVEQTMRSNANRRLKIEGIAELAKVSTETAGQVLRNLHETNPQHYRSWNEQEYAYIPQPGEREYYAAPGGAGIPTEPVRLLTG